MYVVVARLVFHLPAARSLKDRRRVVSRLKERMRSRLPASVCEVGDADQVKSVTLALSVTHREADACRRVVAAARSIGQEVRDAQLLDCAAELLSFGSGGLGLRGGVESTLDGGVYDATELD